MSRRGRYAHAAPRAGPTGRRAAAARRAGPGTIVASVAAALVLLVSAGGWLALDRLDSRLNKTGRRNRRQRFIHRQQRPDHPARRLGQPGGPDQEGGQTAARGTRDLIGQRRRAPLGHDDPDASVQGPRPGDHDLPAALTPTCASRPGMTAPAPSTQQDRTSSTPPSPMAARSWRSTPSRPTQESPSTTTSRSTSPGSPAWSTLSGASTSA